MQLREPRFQVLALGPFQLDDAHIWQAAPLPVAPSDLDGVMARLNSRFFLPLDTDLCPAGGLDFHFDRFKSLNPDGIAKTHPYFRRLLEARAFVQSAGVQGKGADHIRQGLRQWPDLPPLDIAEAAPRPAAPADQSTLDNILNMVAHGDQPADAVAAGRQGADSIDAIGRHILASLFNEIQFQRFESAWRGLRLLLQQGVADTAVSVSLAPVHPENLERRLEALTPHLVQNLPGMILLDLAFDNTPPAMARLTAAARWAETLMVPLIAWAPAAFLQIPSWDKMNTLPFIPHHMETVEYAKYQKLRRSAEGQWLCMACNRFLLRNPYGADNPAHHFPFDEPEPPWVPPLWALGTLIAQSFGQSGWPAGFNDPGRFQVKDLALHARGDKPPMAAETQFDHDRLDQLARAGITPLGTRIGKDSAFFPKAVTLSGASLTYQLLLCQVAQFVLWCKDNLPYENNPAVLEAQLGEALQRFNRQRRPAGFASVRVTAGRPQTGSGRIPLRLVLTPEPSVLPVRQAIELQLDW
jgi:hypothetical protein